MDESVVEGGKDVCNSENSFSFTNLRSEGNDSLLFLYLSFTWGHDSHFQEITVEMKQSKRQTLSIHKYTFGSSSNTDRT